MFKRHFVKPAASAASTTARRCSACNQRKERDDSKAMAFSDDELERIDRVVGALCQRRSPARLWDQIRVGYSVKNHDVLVYESRPGWRNPEEWSALECAKLRYVRVSDEWRLYWKRASGKWWLYEPRTRSTSLAALVREIDTDSHGCFFG